MAGSVEEIIKNEVRFSEKQKTMMAIVYASSQIEKNYETVLEPFSITTNQYQVMRVLLKAYPDSLSVQDIRDNIFDKKSDVPRLLERLNKLHFTEQKKSKLGGKAHRICLTELGFDTLDRIARQVDLSKPVSGITNEEAKLLNSLLLKVIQPLQKQ